LARIRSRAKAGALQSIASLTRDTLELDHLI
jgi:hypothetical protein